MDIEIDIDPVIEKELFDDTGKNLMRYLKEKSTEEVMDIFSQVLEYKQNVMKNTDNQYNQMKGSLTKDNAIFVIVYLVQQEKKQCSFELTFCKLIDNIKLQLGMNEKENTPSQLDEHWLFGNAGNELYRDNVLAPKNWDFKSWLNKQGVQKRIPLSVRIEGDRALIFRDGKLVPFQTENDKEREKEREIIAPLVPQPQVKSNGIDPLELAMQLKKKIKDEKESKISQIHKASLLKKTSQVVPDVPDVDKVVPSPKEGGQILKPSIIPEGKNRIASNTEIHDMYKKLKFLSDKKVKGLGNVEKSKRSIILKRLTRFHAIYGYRLRIAKALIYVYTKIGRDSDEERALLQCLLSYTMEEIGNAPTFRQKQVDKILEDLVLDPSENESDLIMRGLQYFDSRQTDRVYIEVRNAYNKILTNLAVHVKEMDVLMNLIGDSVDFSGYKNYT